MTCDDFSAWRVRMGLDQGQAADRIGCARATIMAWEQGRSSIPLYIAYACAAVAAGLDPVGGHYRPPGCYTEEGRRRNQRFAALSSVASGNRRVAASSTPKNGKRPPRTSAGAAKGIPK